MERRALCGVAHPMGSPGCLTLRVCPRHSGIGKNIKDHKE
jgi:hypothetical protein